MNINIEGDSKNNKIVTKAEWISVEDRLPEEGDYIWIYEPDHGFFSQRQRCVQYYPNDHLWAENLITHWMPLPEPPS